MCYIGTIHVFLHQIIKSACHKNTWHCQEEIFIFMRSRTVILRQKMLGLVNDVCRLDFYVTSRCADSHLRVDQANRLALTVSENERVSLITLRISTNYTTSYRGHGATNAAIAHTVPISTNYTTIYRGRRAKMWQ